MADRVFWAWKTIDFPNATNQGVANGLARLVANSLLPEFLPAPAAVGRVFDLAAGAARLTRRNGSLEEAFPHESSFCVTALVAFDLLAAHESLAGVASEGDRRRLLEIVAPWIEFLVKEDEDHAFISNHLATASAALLRWSRVESGADRAQARGRQLLDRVLRSQSVEGWLPEYGGPDPGYLSLSLYYLADIFAGEGNGKDEFRDRLGRLVQFLTLAAHPDGSFGGWYGSRNTRFLVPAGFEALAGVIPEAAALARFARASISQFRVPPLPAFDAGNFAPFFNAWCWAASLRAGPQASGESIHLPHEQPPFRRSLPGAGWLIDRGQQSYTIISLKKGGVVQHYPSGARAQIDSGVLVEDARGRQFGTQQPESVSWAVEGDVVVVRARFSRLSREIPSPLRFIALRAMSLTLLHLRWFRHWLKRTLVRLLITGVRGIRLWNSRRIDLSDHALVVDTLEGETARYARIELRRPYSAIHMASQGYWQHQDDE